MAATQQLLHPGSSQQMGQSKGIFFLFLIFLGLQLNTFAQSNILLHIHHKMGDLPFALNTGTRNNMGHDVEFTRLEYYLSGISIVHDNGMNTQIDSLWILVNAAFPTQVDLGQHDITNVEAIHFFIGVDSLHNHGDPASYDPSHPLAPKNPSMHWGWASGYRFLALEGNGGSNYNQLVQLHGLGDQNYVKTKLLLSATAANNQINIHLDADYTRALEDISVNGGIIVHGETLEAQQALENFRYFVFSPSAATTATSPQSSLSRLEVFPNPTLDGNTNLWIESTDAFPFEVNITNVSGQQLLHLEEVYPGTPVKITLDSPGMYFINLFKEGRSEGVRKLIVK